jgi:hypothetical protein
MEALARSGHCQLCVDGEPDAVQRANKIVPNRKVEPQMGQSLEYTYDHNNTDLSTLFMFDIRCPARCLWSPQKQPQKEAVICSQDYTQQNKYSHFWRPCEETRE